MNYTQGPGDEQTWPACTGHPNDPRIKELSDDMIESQGEEMAAKILEHVSRQANKINDPRDRLAFQVGMLQGEVRSLCAQLAWKDYE